MIRRTPKNYDGIESPGKKIDLLLPEILGEIARKTGDARQEIFREWDRLVGEQMAPFTEPVSWLDGVLTIKVKNATLYSLLVQHERPKLLKRLQDKFPIRNLVFRVG